MVREYSHVEPDGVASRIPFRRVSRSPHDQRLDFHVLGEPHEIRVPIVASPNPIHPGASAASAAVGQVTAATATQARIPTTAATSPIPSSSRTIGSLRRGDRPLEPRGRWSPRRERRGTSRSRPLLPCEFRTQPRRRFVSGTRLLYYRSIRSPLSEAHARPRFARSGRSRRPPPLGVTLPPEPGGVTNAVTRTVNRVVQPARTDEGVIRRVSIPPLARVTGGTRQCMTR